MVELLGQIEWRVLKTFKVELPYDGAIPFWEYTQENLELGFEKGFVHIYSYSTSHNSQKIDANQTLSQKE